LKLFFERGRKYVFDGEVNSVLATVFRVNKSSISVVTKEKLDDVPAGTRVLVDRAISGRRSASNCARPLI
jgi:hypothetical protein